MSIRRLSASTALLVLASALVAAGPTAHAAEYNGFDVSGALIPVEEIRSGGPPRDGIPAIDEPRFVSAAEATFLAADARVIGLALDGQARAYPISILNWHEVVNDRFGADGVAITFCPLCGTGMAFRAGTAAKPVRFGVSGLLYNSDVLLYDRGTLSLWSQLLSKAISGPLKGRQLEALPVMHTSWADWRARHPRTVVLSRDTGFPRDYGRDPYAAYAESERIMFPVGRTNRSLHPKERVIGISLGGAHKAYPFVELDRSPGPLADRVGGQAVTVEFDAAHRSGRVLDEAGKEIPSVIAFWFAWFAFHPDTAIHKAPEAGTPGTSGRPPM